MTRLSKRPKRFGSMFDEADVQHLLCGPHGLPCKLTAASDQGDDEVIRKAWESLRATLLAKWIAERPGTRPWAWWQFDSPERRRRTDGRVHPFDCKARTLRVAQSDRPDFWKRAYATHWGLPSSFIFPHDEALYADFSEHWPETKIFEGEWEFLQRHGLLLPGDSP